MTAFREAFPKDHRPTIEDLQQYWPPEIASLFRSLAETLFSAHALTFANPSFQQNHGWVYKIGRSGVYIITRITLSENGFTLLDHFVCDQPSYDAMMTALDAHIAREKDAFLQNVAEKNRAQALRAQRKKQQDAQRRAHPDARVNPDKYNKFRWPDKLSLRKLRQLYKNDSEGIKNTELADDIGICLYLRCKYGKEDMELMNQYKLRCHHCDAVLDGHEDFRECACGHQYSYSEYRKSYRKNQMPTGAAATVFNEFILIWPKQTRYEDKMRAIDNLLHAFHLNLTSGTVHRPVAMNFLDGTRAQIDQIIQELAYQ